MKTLLVVFNLLVVTFGYSQNEYVITVYGNCGMCQDRIETAALSVEEVQEAYWNDETKKLSIYTLEDLDIDSVHKAVVAIGHDTDRCQADTEVYNNLHGCCQYREEDHTSDDHSDSNIKINIKSTVDGMVYYKEVEDSPQPLIGANVYWVDTHHGTTTDNDGFFELDKVADTDLLVFEYIGFESDTIDMSGQTSVAVTLNIDNVIDEVTIRSKKKATEVSFINPIKVSEITKKELYKAACCSLSESFETTPAVDVTFTDAITGTRKIEMLGLAGPNVQVMRENMPYIRGIASISGFGMTPGSWINGMQLNTGAGSVVNGPESITGQINVELRKPEDDDRLFVNLYANQAQRTELNITTAHKISNQLSTGFMVHGNRLQKSNDNNNDGYLDAPLTNHIYALNRWKYDGDNGLKIQAGLKGSYNETQSGTLNNLWNAQMDNQRLETWAKIGKVFLDHPDRSIGLQLSFSNHDQESLFGTRRYDAKQNTFYSNLIFADHLGEGKVKLGASFIYDNVAETVVDNNYEREEIMPGVFAEYSQDLNEKVSFVAGIRSDYHNVFGWSVIPRFHFKYNPNEKTSIRLSGGRGQRTASIFAENIGLFASSRTILINSQNEDTPYGLNQEVAYNLGASFTKEWMIDQRSLLFSIDYFYTTFVNQVVVDYDHNVNEVYFYNLNGKSLSHSVQAQLDYEIINGVDIRLAYRYNDVNVDYKDGYNLKALVPKHRAFANLGYAIGKGWEWDGTLSWTGKQRLPNTKSSPEIYRLSEKSPSFFMFNTQLTKSLKDWSFYLGAENVFNYRQKNPIVNAQNPNSSFFDASMVWGPVLGRNVYLGMRYTFK